MKGHGAQTPWPMHRRCLSSENNNSESLAKEKEKRSTIDAGRLKGHHIVAELRYRMILFYR